MRIAVMGAGALGGYFGGRLAAAGNDVALIARGPHLAAIRERGLKIRSPRGDLHLPEMAATDDPATVGPVDVILFMVKNYDVESGARAIAPMLGAETMVITCQNGVSAHQRLGAVIGAGRVVPGVARIPADVPEPGVINHSAMWDGLSFGETDGRVTSRIVRFRDALREAGATAVVPENILHDLWQKFISQAALAGLTTLTRLDIGPLRSNPDSQALFLAAMHETERVGRAVVPDLPEGMVEIAWKNLDNLPDTMHASMLDDLNAGKRLEVDYLSGDVVRLGREHGVPTPIHEVFRAALQPFKNGCPGTASSIAI
ncbi:ketopantoate reductase family protein [Aestuariicoccus sp. MJ-SS9]|uniref:ketopantoate reductase family protein n=1 Tax=Aestuariicoccus sp. MJ-SS9 TaxID=3079855 RepID=UPI0029096669|nr:ketopantoate reductase family protein [Aestuariicoccus sp. MJ-SS9]MDU8910241.1 ketopantoate reductase family protein [Aestuariicoccus sp. MJ-SS9]